YADGFKQVYRTDTGDFGGSDRLLEGMAESRAAVPWPTGGGEPWVWPDAGHLLPERHGPELARRAVEYFRP
ncbi:hypothetical protein C8238_09300, partial [Paracidovorax avenae]|uniref:hypothetical protein n=1 Tax=Paracidovorax avenae TaxID=80867 RepID=UPI000D21E2DC